MALMSFLAEVTQDCGMANTMESPVNVLLSLEWHCLYIHFNDYFFGTLLTFWIMDIWRDAQGQDTGAHTLAY